MVMTVIVMMVVCLSSLTRDGRRDSQYRRILILNELRNRLYNEVEE